MQNQWMELGATLLPVVVLVDGGVVVVIGVVVELVVDSGVVVLKVVPWLNKVRP